MGSSSSRPFVSITSLHSTTMLQQGQQKASKQSFQYEPLTFSVCLTLVRLWAMPKQQPQQPIRQAFHSMPSSANISLEEVPCIQQMPPGTKQVQAQEQGAEKQSNRPDRHSTSLILLSSWALGERCLQIGWLCETRKGRNIEKDN
jgi:hypothetical protein